MENVKKANAQIGQGKAVHTGSFSDAGHWFSDCGADHATNRGMTRYRITNKEVTCKKCLSTKSKRV